MAKPKGPSSSGGTNVSFNQPTRVWVRSPQRTRTKIIVEEGDRQEAGTAIFGRVVVRRPSTGSPHRVCCIGVPNPLSPSRTEIQTIITGDGGMPHIIGGWLAGWHEEPFLSPSVHSLVREPTVQDLDLQCSIFSPFTSPLIFFPRCDISDGKGPPVDVGHITRLSGQDSIVVGGCSRCAILASLSNRQTVVYPAHIHQCLYFDCPPPETRLCPTSYLISNAYTITQMPLLIK